MYFAMGHLHATNIVVMGHYGCAGIAAAIDPQPEEPMDRTSRAVETWVAPIRDLYMTSNRCVQSQWLPRWANETQFKD